MKLRGLAIPLMSTYPPGQARTHTQSLPRLQIRKAKVKLVLYHSQPLMWLGEQDMDMNLWLAVEVDKLIIAS